MRIDVAGIRLEQLDEDALGDVEPLQLDERACRLEQQLAPVKPGWRVARQGQDVAGAPVPTSDPNARLPVVQDPLEVLRARGLDRAPVSRPEPSQRLVDGAADRLPVDGECAAGTPHRGASPRPRAVRCHSSSSRSVDGTKSDPS